MARAGQEPPAEPGYPEQPHTAGTREEEALRLAAAVERDSEHPVARALVESAREYSD